MPDDDLDLKTQVERVERRLLRRALREAKGNQTKAARALGLSRFGLQKKLQDDSPFIIMFQSTEQVAKRNNVSGYVSGPTFDIIYYRLVTKS